MKPLVLISLALLGHTATAQQLAEELQAERVPGVDLCELFTLEEIQELTQYQVYNIKLELDHNPDVPGRWFGMEFWPDSNPNVDEPGGVVGVGDIPYNGLKCRYRGSGGLVDFRYYSNEREILERFSHLSFDDVQPGIVAHEFACFVQPTDTSHWIMIQVQPLDMEVSRAEKRRISCQIAVEGNVNERALRVARGL